MDYHKFIVSNQKEEFISIQRVKLFQIYEGEHLNWNIHSFESSAISYNILPIDTLPPRFDSKEWVEEFWMYHRHNAP